ncbi:MAG: 2Fe-2S iron-sulfur cluster binding domain-containing protein [Cyanobacteria bacterium K_Offshore_surface_m2_239]|nr:2Fe-2S iron-sulfur cluster binding domain-containing protein [Cyanobacteria bacterium K_Offshore_surface_m2_239]
MPVIRFLREGRDVECFPGENLREVALRVGIELYGLKGKLGNCGGCGQCITCFVDVQGAQADALSPLTAVESQKLKRRPASWRLACQSLVQRSVVVLTRPQSGLPNGEEAWTTALRDPLPPGPLAWPEEEEAVEEAPEAGAPPSTATTDEGPSAGEGRE